VTVPAAGTEGLTEELGEVDALGESDGLFELDGESDGDFELEGLRLGEFPDGTYATIIPPSNKRVR
jgi:hypothetical protein